MNYQQTLDWLFSQLPIYQRVGGAAYKANLNNTLLLMEHLQHPENGFKSIHIAGTNGKGSTSHMLASIFQQAGYKTGLYTSPHLKDFRERIKINGALIPEEKVTHFIENNKSFFTENQLSFFEMTVGMAFEYFAQEKVDIAIVETGMGGRLDSTNVLLPELSIITNISLDHTKFLGDSKAKIAFEKAGIIKKETPVIIGERNAETDTIFTSVAHEKNSPIYFATDTVSSQEIAYKTDLYGAYQEKNLRTVIAVLHLLENSGYTLKSHLKIALQNIVKNTGLHGRWETLGERPKVVCDTAHNEAGIYEVVSQIKKQSYRQLHIVWGMVSDKNVTPILQLLPKSAIYYFCKPNIPRGKDAEELKREALRLGLSGKSYRSVATAYAAARKQTLTDDFIFIGGSTFVVAEVL